MSYYIMVVDHHQRFRNGKDFKGWYNDVTQWNDSVDYNDYHHSSESLQKWFLEMKDVVKPLNGEFAPSDEELDTGQYPEADYCIGRDFIYVAFALTDANKTTQIAFDVAKKNNLAFFDASGTEELYFPDGHHLNFSSSQPSAETKTEGSQVNKHNWLPIVAMLIMVFLVFLYQWLKNR